MKHVWDLIRKATPVGAAIWGQYIALQFIELIYTEYSDEVWQTEADWALDFIYEIHRGYTEAMDDDDLYQVTDDTILGIIEEAMRTLRKPGKRFRGAAEGVLLLGKWHDDELPVIPTNAALDVAEECIESMRAMVGIEEGHELKIAQREALDAIVNGRVLELPIFRLENIYEDKEAPVFEDFELGELDGDDE